MERRLSKYMKYIHEIIFDRIYLILIRISLCKVTKMGEQTKALQQPRPYNRSLKHVKHNV